MTRKLLVFVGFSLSAVLAGPVLAEGGKKSSGGADYSSAPLCTSIGDISGDFVCNCPSNASSGSVWGSGPYTADSNLCTAARHAGAITGAGGPVRVIERPGQSSYSGSSANGVTTSNWGTYGKSFDVVSVGGGAAVKSSLPACSTIPAGVEAYSCSCAAGAAAGSVWGNGPYTADSDICTAALHTGYIDAAGGEVHVLRLPGLASYTGMENNGVTSSDWGAYGESITFDWNK